MRTKTGIITSAKMQNTVTVTVHRYVMHDKYAKRFRVSKKFLADTNGMELHMGDEVVIAECRPLSKRKCFKVSEIKKKAHQFVQIKDEDAEKGIKRDHRDSNATPRK
ncbi:MAG: 30S ribosomal protein S17 [Candidatus Peribacteraceae bacterium]|nr:30S ribosomal protein S17 [Candidatus Peribacteraceae bacterium]